MHYKYNALSVGVVLLSLGAGKCLIALQRHATEGSREHWRECDGWSLVGPRRDEDDERERRKMVSRGRCFWFQNEMGIVTGLKDALEECDARDGLATSKCRCIWMGGREAGRRGCDLPNAVLMRILFDVSAGSKPGGRADTLQMDVLEYIGIRGRRKPGPVKQCGRGEQFVPRYAGVHIHNGRNPAAGCGWGWVVLHWVCGTRGRDGAAHRRRPSQGRILARAECLKIVYLIKTIFN